MRRVLLSLALLGLLGVPAEAESTLWVRGRVVDGAGDPVAGARVSFELRPNPENYSEKDCPVKPWLIQCRVHEVAGTTDAKGRYRLPVKRSSYLASPKQHHIVVTDRTVPGALAPAESWTTVYFPMKSMDIADIRVWRGEVSIEPDGPVHRLLHVEQLTAEYGQRKRDAPVAELLQGSRVAWTFPGVTADRQVDARVVEIGTTAIRMWDEAIASRLPIHYTSPAWPVSGGVTPLSRRATCWTYGRDDVLVPLSGCRYTDGRLATPIDPRYMQAGGKGCDVGSLCDHPRWVLVDLGEAQLVGASAIRGCLGGEREVSLDGTTYVSWRPGYDNDSNGLFVAPPVLVRYVRVDLDPCVYDATELSVFAPLP
jgi:hypothetical protein